MHIANGGSAVLKLSYMDFHDYPHQTKKRPPFLESAHSFFKISMAQNRSELIPLHRT